MPRLATYRPDIKLGSGDGHATARVYGHGVEYEVAVWDDNTDQRWRWCVQAFATFEADCGVCHQSETTTLVVFREHYDSLQEASERAARFVLGVLP